jgi:hypothetical protein
MKLIKVNQGQIVNLDTVVRATYEELPGASKRPILKVDYQSGKHEELSDDDAKTFWAELQRHSEPKREGHQPFHRHFHSSLKAVTSS